MRQYSPDNVKLSWLGIPDWENGLAEGVNIRETRAAQNFSYKPNGYGDVVPMFDPNLSGTLVITFDRESKEHARLVTFANLDLGTRSLVAPMLITDTTTKNVQLYNQARIAVQANYVSGSGPSTVPWIFIFAQAVSQVFGFDNNLVGS